MSALGERKALVAAETKGGPSQVSVVGINKGIVAVALTHPLRPARPAGSKEKWKRRGRSKGSKIE